MAARIMQLLEEPIIRMKFIFMVFHYPKPDHRESLLKGMSETASFFKGKPGFIDAGAWVDENNPECLVGVSFWNSKQAFFDAGMTFAKPDEIVAGETKPRERFFFERM